jgi:hypothetical protein
VVIARDRAAIGVRYRSMFDQLSMKGIKGTFQMNSPDRMRLLAAVA